MESSFAAAHATFASLERNLERVMVGQKSGIRKLLAAFGGGGHLLLNDVPGTGKTTLAKGLARAVNAGFKRIQFTPDLLPSDILGVAIFAQREQEFRFRPGPIFTHILLADEINRASPRTQSALLEAMAEGQVSIDGDLHRLEEPFFVIATQNPVEFHGTYPLPEAQMDRFALCFSLGYVSAEAEVELLANPPHAESGAAALPGVGLDEVIALRRAVGRVRATPEVCRYIVELVRATRGRPGVKLGASFRGAAALFDCSRALALLDGREYLTPEPIQELAVEVLAHRLVLDPQARFAGLSAAGVVREILAEVVVPG